jgi:RNA polymerase sigma-70 factor (ECF subfamily)
LHVASYAARRADLGPDLERADREAGVLFERHRGRVYRFCLARLGDREEAADAVQDTFTKGWIALRDGCEVRQPLAWLLTIASNVCTSRHRARRARPAETPLLEDTEASVTHLAPVELASLPEALRALPEEQRRVFILRELRGCSYDEIGQAVGASQPAVTGLLHRARRSVAASLAGAGRSALAAIPLPGFVRAALEGGGAVAATASVTVAASAALLIVGPVLPDSSRAHAPAQPPQLAELDARSMRTPTLAPADGRAPTARLLPVANADLAGPRPPEPSQRSVTTADSAIAWPGLVAPVPEPRAVAEPAPFELPTPSAAQSSSASTPASTPVSTTKTVKTASDRGKPVDPGAQGQGQGSSAGQGQGQGLGLGLGQGQESPGGQGQANPGGQGEVSGTGKADGAAQPVDPGSAGQAELHAGAAVQGQATAAGARPAQSQGGGNGHANGPVNGA